MSNTYYIININLSSVVSDDPIVEVPCGDCSLCCRLSPYLTPEKISSGKYPMSFVQPNEIEIQNNIGPKVILFRKNNSCGMLLNNKCSIYEDRPFACRQFDCRKNHHPEIPDMTKK